MKMKYFIILIFFILGIPYAVFSVANGDELTVSGNKILLNGSQITLRGVAMGSFHHRAVLDKRNNNNDYSEIKNGWDANTVRISMHPGVYMNDKSRGLSLFESEIQSARNRGLFVIIDWHAIGFPNGWHKTNGGKLSYYSYESDFEVARDFWRYAAKKFKDDRGVIFELWNEPAIGSGEIYWSSIRPSMQSLYGLVRGNGAENLVLIPGVYWSYDLRGIKDNPINGYNVGYVWHAYKVQDDNYLDWNTALDGLHEKYPVVVTEWGFEETGDYKSETNRANFGLPISEYIEENGLHFTAWCWHDAWKPRMFEEDNWSSLTVFGSLVNDFLLYPEKARDRMTIRQNKYREAVDNFINNGVDANSIRLGQGERAAVVYSYEQAFGDRPKWEMEWQDLIKIVNGRWPKERSRESEARANSNFQKIYKRSPNMSNSHDNAAITVMAYGLRQRAENRNLDSERKGISIFKSIFGRYPSTTEEWNVMQAITYSGATR